MTSPCVIAKKNTDSTAPHTRYSPPRCLLLLTLLLAVWKNYLTPICGDWSLVVWINHHFYMMLMLMLMMMLLMLLLLLMMMMTMMMTMMMR